MTRRNRYGHPFDHSEVPPETSYLVEDVVELVNDRFDAFLDNAPFQIKAVGFRPELISGMSTSQGIDMLGQEYLPHAPAGRDFMGIDLLFRFPVKSGGENPFNITLNWSDNTDVRLAVVDKRPLIIAEESGENGEIFRAEELHPEIMSAYLESLHLPDSLWEDDVKEITRDLYNCPEVLMTRSAKTQVDLGTTLEIVHDARMAQDVDDNKQLLQELCINIDHESPDMQPLAGHLYLRPYAKYRNMLRFERTSDDTAWKFAGAYHGHLGVGDLIDELVQINPTLGIPGSRVLDKALATLSQVERAK